MMTVFDLVFPILMILLPGVFALFIRARPSGDEYETAQSATLARLQRRLFAWTAVILGVYSALRWIGASSGTVDEAADFMWLAFFPLWFKGVMPLLPAKDVGWGPRPIAATRRAASLVRRDTLPATLRALLIAAWLVWSGLTLATVAILVRSEAPQWWLLLFALFGAVELLLGGWFARSSALEPEPLDPAGSPDLQAAYAGLRRLKQGGWVAGTAVGMVLFTVVPLLMAWNAAGNLVVAIWIGAGGGSLLGSAGAIVGVIADVQRARINRRYHELTADTAA
jgi:hypothetical protein